LANNIGERIREMAELLDEEYIARALNFPVDTVRGVLSGEIPDSALEKFDPLRPPEVRIVEQEKFVHSKLIGILSTGGCGATALTASLAVLSAKKSNLSVVAVDLNELSYLGYAFGLDVLGEQAAFFPNILWWNTAKDVKSSLIQHPVVDNLFFVLGAATAERYAELRPDRVADSLKALAGAYSSVWVDCPTSPLLWKNITPYLDMLIFVVRPDISHLISLWQAISMLKEQKTKTVVVINGENGEGALSTADCRRIINETTGLSILASLPEDPGLRKASNNSLCYALEKPKSPYIESVAHILDVLQPQSKKKKTILSGVAGFLKNSLANL
jgi:MinD-like ATPase involved in chromosome partitioning or flagellar assembly